MAENLTTTQAEGTQTATQNPQTAGAAASGGTRASDVQSGTAASVLNTSPGVQLQSTPLTTVPLTTSAVVLPKPKPAPKPANYLGTGLAVVLFVLAAVLFIAIARGDKTTTT
jgi:hypothetical protein